MEDRKNQLRMKYYSIFLVSNIYHSEFYRAPIVEACLGFLIIWNNGLFFQRNKNNLDFYSENMR